MANSQSLFLACDDCLSPDSAIHILIIKYVTHLHRFKEYDVGFSATRLRRHKLSFFKQVVRPTIPNIYRCVQVPANMGMADGTIMHSY